MFLAGQGFTQVVDAAYDPVNDLFTLVIVRPSP